MRLVVCLLCFVTLSHHSFAQNVGSVLPGVSDLNSVPNVSVGEVTTFTVFGLNPSALPAYASHIPLPLQLAGIAATIHDPFQGSVSAPLLSIVSGSNCDTPYYSEAKCSGALLITVQIPFEIRLTPAQQPSLGAVDNLEFNDAAGNAASITVQIRVDQIQILAVTDSSGKTVSTVHPGDTLVFYATGLGLTDPLIPTGATASSATPLQNVLPIVANFDFSSNAQPIRPVLPPYGYPSLNPLYSIPLFEGLLPGYVGLYQVNVKIPPAPSGLPPCGNDIASNLTITLIGSASFAGLPFCVSANQ